MNTAENNIVYVKARLDSSLHRDLKEIADSEKRSMTYLLNEAVKLLVSQTKEAKA